MKNEENSVVQSWFEQSKINFTTKKCGKYGGAIAYKSLFNGLYISVIVGKYDHSDHDHSDNDSIEVSVSDCKNYSFFEDIEEMISKGENLLK